MDVAVYYFPFGDRQPFLLVRQENCAIITKEQTR